MTNEEGGRRAKRQCARKNQHASAVPSAVHYVGYVEDDETPEMIMAKFAELERIKQATVETKKDDAAPEEGTSGAEETNPADPTIPEGLTDEQLLEVFKQTSMFSVKTALQDNSMLMHIDDLLDYTQDRYGSDDDVSDDELRSFWSEDEDFDDYSERRRGGKKGTRGGVRLQRNAAGVKARHNTVTAYNPNTQALVRRKVKGVDRFGILQIQIPSPLPLSWGRTVQPYVPLEMRGTRKEAVPGPPPAEGEPEPTHVSGYIELDDVVDDIQPKSLPATNYQAVLINPGWEQGHDDPAQAVAALAKIPLPKLVPTGFVFIWTDKEYVQPIFKQMTKWGYIYIENLTWVWMGANNKILTRESEYVRKSHLSLYMFRAAGKGKDIELRHQRNPDVTFDCLTKAKCQPMGIPDETFVAVETLLPTGKGKYLELWAPQGVQRPGWTHLVKKSED